jgi:hypothetical protein
MYRQDYLQTFSYCHHETTSIENFWNIAMLLFVVLILDYVYLANDNRILNRKLKIEHYQLPVWTSERRAVPAPLMTSWCCSCWEVDLNAFESLEFRIHRSIPNDDRGILESNTMMSLVEQELLVFPTFKPAVGNVQFLVFCSIFCCSLFVFFIFWSLHYRSYSKRTSYIIQAFRTYFQINKSTLWVHFI